MTSLKGICRCCLSQGKFKSIDNLPPSSCGRSYAEMLNDILGSPLCHTGEVQLICGTCSSKLCQAIAFRNQVQAAEKTFVACLHQQPPEIKRECSDDDEITMIIPHEKVEIMTDDCHTNSIDNEDRSLLEKCGMSPHNDSSVVSRKLLQKTDEHLPKLIANNASVLLLENSEIISQKDSSLILLKLLQNTGDILNKTFLERRTAETKNILLAGISKSLSEKNENVYCKKCEKHFPHVSSFKSHVLMCNRTCHSCKINFKNPNTLRRHKVDVHREGFVCNICDFIFAEKNRLVMHQRRIHMREKNVKCAHCKFEAFNKAHLASHMRAHYDVRPYACRICNKKFKKSNSKNCHERIHSGDKRKICQLCGEKFVQRASLKYHLEKYHPGDA